MKIRKTVSLKIVSLLLSFIFVVASCSPNNVSMVNDELFNQIWEAYVVVEFQESFVENLPVDKRRKIIEDFAVKLKINPNSIWNYMKENHPEKYSYVYLGR